MDSFLENHYVFSGFDYVAKKRAYRRGALDSGLHLCGPVYLQQVHVSGKMKDNGLRTSFSRRPILYSQHLNLLANNSDSVVEFYLWFQQDGNRTKPLLVTLQPRQQTGFYCDVAFGFRCDEASLLKTSTSGTLARLPWMKVDNLRCVCYLELYAQLKGTCAPSFIPVILKYRNESNYTLLVSGLEVEPHVFATVVNYLQCTNVTSVRDLLVITDETWAELNVPRAQVLRLRVMLNAMLS
jgi:hypothetical protein